MKLSDTAAAHGHFQVVFADVTDHLAVATFQLRKRREPPLRFEEVFKQGFSRTLLEFRRELCQFAATPGVAENLDTIREACKTISALSVWRNDRIHAHVRMTDTGYVLFSWQTQQPLPLNYTEIERHIHTASSAIVNLDVHVSHLLHELDWEEACAKLATQYRNFYLSSRKTSKYKQITRPDAYADIHEYRSLLA